MSCPRDGNYDSCEIINDGRSQYVKVVGRTVKTVPKVAAARKTPAGAYLALVSYLKKNQENGIDYAYINQYFRAEFEKLGDDNPMGMGFMSEILTYDPRHDSVKDYSDIFAALKQAPKSLDWTQMWGIIDGLNLS